MLRKYIDHTHQITSHSSDARTRHNAQYGIIKSRNKMPKTSLYICVPKNKNITTPSTRKSKMKNDYSAYALCKHTLTGKYIHTHMDAFTC